MREHCISQKDAFVEIHNIENQTDFNDIKEITPPHYGCLYPTLCKHYSKRWILSEFPQLTIEVAPKCYMRIF
jgi:hypothetical protein